MSRWNAHTAGRPTKTARLLAILSLTVFVITASCSGSSESSDDGVTHLTVSVAQAKDINGVPWEVARSNGYFEDEGIVIDEVLPAEGGGETLQNVIAGDLPFGQVATSALVNAHIEGAPIKIIAGATQVPHEIGWGVLKDSQIQSVDDLEGKTWGFTNAGSVTEAMSYLVPKHADLDMSSIKHKATGGVGDGIALLESGDVDVTFIPPLTEAEHSDDIRVVVHADEIVPDYELTMIVSSRDYAKKNPETTKGLLKALQKAIDWIDTNPDKAGEVYASQADLNPSVGKKLIKEFNDVDVFGLAFNPAPLNAVEEGLKYTDDIDSVDWDELLTDEYLPEGNKGEIPN